MKKTLRPPAVTAADRAARDHELARERLRRFAQFIRTQDPAALAASVTQFEMTFESCRAIEKFFKTYVQALRSRRPH